MGFKIATPEDILSVNDEFMTFDDRRRRLFDLLYGNKPKSDRQSILMKWLDRDSRVAAQSLVDSHLAKYHFDKDNGEQLIPRRSILFGQKSAMSRL